MTKANLQQIAVAAAHNHGLDPALVCAICHHESDNWKPWAIRFEPGFYRRYTQPMALSDTEEHSRAISYGLMQVMGQVAREFGFEGEFLTELCDPLTNLEYGCRKLAREMDKASGNIRQALLGYNGGGNLAYPDLVLRHYDQYRRTE